MEPICRLVSLKAQPSSAPESLSICVDDASARLAWKVCVKENCLAMVLTCIEDGYTSPTLAKTQQPCQWHACSTLWLHHSNMPIRYATLGLSAFAVPSEHKL